MGFLGGPTSMALGGTQEIILGVNAGVLASSVVLDIDIWGPYRGRYVAIFQGGVYLGQNTYVPLDAPIRLTVPMKSNDSTTSIYIEDAGDWEEFSDEDIPDEMALQYEASTAQILTIHWTATYSVQAPRDDSQLASVVVTGAARGANCELLEDMPTRAQLSYSIKADGTTRTVQWWNGTTLVAEGSRVGNGSVTCAEVDGSGLSITATLTYTAEVVPQTAYVELHWPASYQIHYSTSSLSYPRAAELNELDNGGTDAYVRQSGVLTAGNYNYNVLTVDDEGDVQTSPSAPSDSPKTIYAPPTAPTITSVTGNAAALVVNWTVGVSGCTYTVYASKANTPINFGLAATPAPITTALNATSATLAAIVDYAAHDQSADFSTLQAAFDAAVTAINSDYSSDGDDFLAELATQNDTLIAALTTYGDGVLIDPYSYQAQIAAAILTLNGIATELNTEYPTLADFQTAIALDYAGFLAMLGNVLRKQPGRYALPDGTTNADGQSTSGVSLYDLSLPASRAAIYRVIVRATKSGVQEMTDREYVFELSNAGALVPTRPANASIDKITVSLSYLVAVQASVITDDSQAAAVYIDFYIVAHNAGITLASPTQSVAVTTAVAGLQRATCGVTVGGAGYYDIAVLARAADGTRSKSYRIITRHMSNATPPAAASISADVARGREARPR